MVPYMHSVSISSSGFCTRHVTTRQTLTCLLNMDKLCYTQIMLRHDICSSRLHSMLWLPVQRRVEFKIACLPHKSITSTALTYLSADIQLCLSMVVIIFAHLPTNTRSSTHAYHSPLQKFCPHRTACLEQFTGYSKTDHQLWTV